MPAEKKRSGKMTVVTAPNWWKTTLSFRHDVKEKKKRKQTGNFLPAKKKPLEVISETHIEAISSFLSLAASSRKELSRSEGVDQ